MDKKIVLSVPAKIENNTEVIDYIDEYLENNGCPMREKMQVVVAIDEIVTNIASYAYENAEGLPEDLKLTIVEIELTAEGVSLTFVDNGTPYNPLENEDPDITLSAEERGIGGLGIFMVKKSMDKVEYSYENNQNRLKITKNFPVQ